MTLVIERGEMVTEGAARQGKAIPSRFHTTLYDLITVVQDAVGPEDDVLVVATVVHLLQTGRCTWGDRTVGPLQAALSGTSGAVIRNNRFVVWNAEDTDAQGESTW